MRDEDLIQALLDEDLIQALLTELQYVLSTGNIPDSERNSAELRDFAAKRLGFAGRKAFARREKGQYPAMTRSPNDAARAALAAEIEIAGHLRIENGRLLNSNEKAAITAALKPI